MQSSSSMLLRATSAINSSPTPPPPSTPPVNEFAQDWLQDMISSTFPAYTIFISVAVFTTLFILYDYYRPSIPFQFSTRLRRKRVANWTIMTFVIAAEVTSICSLHTLAAAPKATLEECGLTYRHIYIINALRFFVKPVGFFIHGIMIDKFAKLQSGKYLLIFSLLLQVLLNFLTGTAVTWGSHSGSGGGTEHASEHGFAAQIFSVFGLLSEGESSAASPAWGKARVPMFFITYIVSAYLQTFSEIVLTKLCAIWYRTKEERATIAGILNLIFCFELMMAYPFNAYLFRIFESVPAFQFVSSGLLSIAALCVLFLNVGMVPQDDMEYYMYLFHKEQQKVEEEQLEKAQGLNIDMYLHNSENFAVSANPEHDIEEALEEMNQEERQSRAEHEQQKKELENSIIATNFPFKDPFRLNTENYSIKDVLLRIDIWIFASCGLVMGIIHEDWYTWVLNYVSRQFNVGATSMWEYGLIIFLTMAPAISIWFSVALYRSVASTKFSIAIIPCVIGIILAAMNSVVAYSKLAEAVIIFAVLGSVVRLVGYSARRFWQLDIGGAAYSGIVTAIMSSAWNIGLGLGSLIFKRISNGESSNKVHGLLLVIIPLYVAIFYMLMSFYQHIQHLVRKI